MTKLQAKTLGQIAEKPGFYKVAVGQPGFNMTSARSLKKKGLVRYERPEGDPWNYLHLTAEGEKVLKSLAGLPIRES